MSRLCRPGFQSRAAEAADAPGKDDARLSGPYWHYSPKIMRASSSLSRLCSSRSRVDARRSAKAKKRFFSCSRASRPVSMSSTRIRLALVWLDSARDLTRRAVLGGRLTLWRTGFSAVAMARGYTNMHHGAPGSSWQRARSTGSARDVGSGARAGPLLLLDTRDLFGQL